MASIAIVGMACRYPDARSPGELWDNVLAQRRSFRRMPPERLRLEDYYSPDRAAVDAIYSTEAALIDDYDFDRARFRVSGSTFRATDMAHWLTLDVASQALADAGFPDGQGLPRSSTSVIIANTLTGDQSRANVLRLRWPYVRRAVAAALDGRTELDHAARRAFLARLEEVYKAPFPAVGEDSLAGGLSNTIAGRVCNYFDLKGGGYTVDGACASSLLAVIHAATALVGGDADVALAGGVDLSLDPFELVGFAKAGALADGEMRVYDRRSCGFWPGEGCGVVVLMRLDDALAQRRKVLARLDGWGISSDGGGGMTRPEVEGQKLALRRAYARAGFGIETVGYFEGHGTGTVVGDATEIEALDALRRESAGGGSLHPAAIGSIKANIGHTKAAAGLAGLIKAVLAVDSRLRPPTTACSEPHPRLLADGVTLRTLERAQPWTADAPVRAAVSSMGFGGINAHVVISAAHPRPAPRAHAARRASARQAALLRTPQDAELFLFAADSAPALHAALHAFRPVARELSRAELADAAAWSSRSAPRGPFRAALVAGSPSELTDSLVRAAAILADGRSAQLDVANGLFLGTRDRRGRIVFLFPGQASPTHRNGVAWRRRFDTIDQLYLALALPVHGDDADTAIAQPGIVAAQVAGLRALALLDVDADAALGHSLGELTALHWAGAFDESNLLRLAQARGAAFAALPAADGAMAAIAADSDTVSALLPPGVVVAGHNAPRVTVVSGASADVAETLRRAVAAGLRATPLRVSHAFHSPWVAAAEPALRDALARVQWRHVEREVVSTVSGAPVAESDDPRDLLLRQITSPVRFRQALQCAAAGADLLIEVGPGHVLTGLAAECGAPPCVPLDANGPSFRGLLAAVGAAYCLGHDVRHEALFEGRALRPFDPNRRPRFLVSPCESLPADADAGASRQSDPALDPVRTAPPPPPAPAVAPVARIESGSAAAQVSSVFDTVRRLVAAKAELPIDSVRGEDRLLADLHLNSIVVGRIVVEASHVLGLPGPAAPTEFATSTVAGVADALTALAATHAAAGPARPAERFPAGLESWVRPFVMRWVERPRPAAPAHEARAASWRVFSTEDNDVTRQLRDALSRAPGVGVALILTRPADQSHVETLLEAAQTAAGDPTVQRFVLVQAAAGAASLARTLRLEAPRLATLVVEAPLHDPRCAQWILDELAAAGDHVEVRFDADGRRTEPVLCPLPADDVHPASVLGPDDVMLVTGGGKGLAAECALALAREHGLSLALLGRADPARDDELRRNLARFTDAGVRHRYVVADVTDPAAVRRAVSQAAALGPISAILHGAGRNQPRLLNDLTPLDFADTAAPKVAGLRNVLAAVDPQHLRLLVAFGSVIARTGMAGEAHYALANEWLARAVDAWAADHPRARALTLEWSIWSGVGMGERLGRVEALAQQGISAISPEQGVRALRELLAHGTHATAVVVSGRLGQVPTVRFESAPRPFLRFLGETRIHTPAVELVVEADLSRSSDPYVDHHAFHGERLFPAVVGLEALAQVAAALYGGTVTGFESVSLARPIVVPADGATRIRLVALARGTGRVEAAIRCADTQYQVDHFRAVIRIGQRTATLGERATAASAPAIDLDGSVPLDPGRDLYGTLLFHTGPFRRVAGYRRLRARDCLAELAPATAAPWFGPYEAPTLLLGDPAARDAAIHCIQACIPHATILPVGVERIDLLRSDYDGVRLVAARETRHDGDLFVYDVNVLDNQGRPVERWIGLKLRAVAPSESRDAWPEPLMAVYLERRLAELGLPGLRVALTSSDAPAHNTSKAPSDGANGNGNRNGSGKRAHLPRRSQAAFHALLGAPAVSYRTDGKPQPVADGHVSASHAGPLTLAVAAPNAVGCDLEPVAPRPNGDWRELLGEPRHALALRVATEAHEPLEAAATRVWTAIESLKKAGASFDAQLTLRHAHPDGWVSFAADGMGIASYVGRLRGTSGPLALAVVLELPHARV